MAMMPVLVAMAISRFDERAKDWRCGAVVYQVFVDRFAPPADPEGKRALYPAPKRLRKWSEVPAHGTAPGREPVWSHELDYWGGDLPSLVGKLDYIRGLGADALYLTPIFAALTNHKYDAQDYFAIAPEFGSHADLRRLATGLHRRRMKLVLDGVFNHMGRTSPLFQAALKNPKDPRRDWFFIGDEYPQGYRGWAGTRNLVALRLENAKVRDYLWNGPNSVVRRYLRDGVDGWRLDVGFELGPQYLAEITRVAHATKPGSLVVGEINGYPADWFPSVDGVYNFAAPNLVVQCLKGEIAGGRVGMMLGDMVADAGIENILRSWLHLDNHDTPRLAHVLPDLADRRLAVAANMTLPGSPVVYYGTELGMGGAGDPHNRAPMRWDLATASNPDLAWTKKLIALRKAHPALRYGDFKPLQSERLLAFARTTDRLKDAAIVVMNPTDQTVTERFAHRIGWLMSWGELRDALGTEKLRQSAGLLGVTLPPKSVRVFVPVFDRSHGYSPYDRLPG